ncbi:hypothetical protein [Nocardia alni]|uniref:hypothetical protein n=1 Tax=Nocardia alni TaxID=2815723 RepID=UPI001C22EB9E|nr:hypothetical protein [Nocardia alni]
MINSGNRNTQTRFIDTPLTHAWQGWLGQRTRCLEQFYSEVRLPADRYSSAGLHAAEHSLLALFPESTVPEPIATFLAGCDRLAVERYARYFGEVLVASLDGYWHNDPAPEHPDRIRATIVFEYTDARIHVTDWVHRALRARDGRVWASLHAGLSEWCSVWWQSGRATRLAAGDPAPEAERING